MRMFEKKRDTGESFVHLKQKVHASCADFRVFESNYIINIVLINKRIVNEQFFIIMMRLGQRKAN